MHPGTVSAALENTSASSIVFTINAEDGTPLQTTLDPRLQALAEAVLEDEPSASALVAIQPSTGDVLTVANGPGSEGQQTALLGQYPPGSTFKIATSLALLRQGITPDSRCLLPGGAQRRRPQIQQCQQLSGSSSWATSRCGTPSPSPATPPSSTPGTRFRRIALASAAEPGHWG